MKSEDVEVMDDIKIYVLRVRKKKFKIEGILLDGLNVCLGNNKEMKRDSLDVVILVMVKEEICFVDKVEISKEIILLVIVLLFNFSG